MSKNQQQVIHRYGLYRLKYMQGFGRKPLNPYNIEKNYNELGFIDFHSWLVHKKTGQIVDPTPQTVDALMKLDLSAGVDVEIKL